METEIQQALPCPFCGSTDLSGNRWQLNGGEVDAVECNACYAGAPLTAWNTRVDQPEASLINQLSGGEVPEHLKNL